MKVSIIAAVSNNGVIGQDNKIPWSCPEDMAHFKAKTLNSTVIMGRKTFESMGSRCLPKRNNILVAPSLFDNTLKSLSTKGKLPQNLILEESLESALNKAKEFNNSIYFIGGASIYSEAMKYADEILLSIIDTYVKEDNVIKFPWINPLKFSISEVEDKETFKLIKYTKV